MLLVTNILIIPIYILTYTNIYQIFYTSLLIASFCIVCNEIQKYIYLDKINLSIFFIGITLSLICIEHLVKL